MRHKTKEYLIVWGMGIVTVIAACIFVVNVESVLMGILLVLWWASVLLAFKSAMVALKKSEPMIKPLIVMFVGNKFNPNVVMTILKGVVTILYVAFSPIVAIATAWQSFKRYRREQQVKKEMQQIEERSANEHFDQVD